MQKYLLLLVAFIANSCVAQTPFNGSFERINSKTHVPEGWVYGFNNAQQIAYPPKLDSIIKKEGRYSVSIARKSKESDFGVIGFVIPNSFKGKDIELTGYMKTEAVANGFAGLWLRLDDEDGNTVKFDNMQSQAITGTNDWKQYTIKLAYEEKVKRIHLGGLIVGDGKVWFDDLQLQIDGKKIQTLKPLPLAVAETDTAFNKGSQISNFNPNKQQISNIVVAGQFWGFLKYHHPAVAKGTYNWDAELFRLLPRVIKAENNVELSKTLEKYLDQLPKVELCKSCDGLNSSSVMKPNYGELLSAKVLSPSLTEKISYILKNANLKENYYLSMQRGVGNPKFEHEKSYGSMAYPDAGYRILSLYRYWNMINYFFPYKDVIGEDWNTVFTELAPAFIKAENQQQYLLAVFKMVAKINDTHAYLTGQSKVVEELRGKNTTPFRAKFVEEKLVIYDYFSTADSIKNTYRVGDEILAINGEKVSDLIKRYDPLIAASNYDTKLRNLPLAFLLRSNANTMKLEIKRGETVFQKNIALMSYISTYTTPKPSIKAYKVIDGNIGYVYPGSYKNTDLPAIKELFKNTDGMVIDMRCYPSDFMPFTFGEYIKQDKTPFAKFTMGSVTKPGTFVMGNEVSNGGNKNAYKGKIVILVNEESQSNAEYTTMSFQGSANVKVVGSQTAGADGNVSTIVLPGGVSSWISGIGVFYPDGTPTQRVGVKIDYPIKPTVKGITEGKDELLEKAISLLKKSW